MLVCAVVVCAVVVCGGHAAVMPLCHVTCSHVDVELNLVFVEFPKGVVVHHLSI